MGAAVSARTMARQAEEGPSEGGEKGKSASGHVAEEVLAGPAAVAGEETKKVVRRMSQAQVDRILAYAPTPFPDPATLVAGLVLPAPVQEKLAGLLADAARIRRQSQETRLAEQARVRREVEEKGYAEIEVVEEEDRDGVDEEEDGDGVEEEVVVPRRGRRRYRPGVKKEAGGPVTRVN